MESTLVVTNGTHDKGANILGLLAGHCAIDLSSVTASPAEVVAGTTQSFVYAAFATSMYVEEIQIEISADPPNVGAPTVFWIASSANASFDSPLHCRAIQVVHGDRSRQLVIIPWMATLAAAHFPIIMESTEATALRLHRWSFYAAAPRQFTRFSSFCITSSASRMVFADLVCH